jgi:PEGA domain
LFAMCAGGVFAWQWSRGYDQAGIAMQPNVLASPSDAAPGLAAHSSWMARLLEPFQSAHFAHVTIATVPSGATVSLAGAELGTTPYSLQLKGTTIVELSLPGHASQRITVEPSGEPNLVVKLVPLPPFRSALQPPL